MIDPRPYIKIDDVDTREEAERIWYERQKEPDVISTIFYQYSQTYHAPKKDYPPVWRVHSLYRMMKEI